MKAQLVRHYRRGLAWFGCAILENSRSVHRSSSPDWDGLVTRPTAAPVGGSTIRPAARRLLRSGRLARRLLVVPPSREIAHSLHPAMLGMPASRGHRKRVAGAVGTLFALAGNRDLAFEDEQPRVELVCMLGVYRVRLHAAIDDFAISFCA